MKFLVVDDSATMRRIIINSLQRIGYEKCVEAADGLEALNAFDASIEFIITDWNMPNMDGLEMVRSIRANPSGRSVPIIMVTTRGVREDVVEAAQAGVNNYLVKPFTPEVLKGRIEQVLAARGAA